MTGVFKDMTHKHHNDKKQDNDWEEAPADIPAEEAAAETGAPDAE